MAHSFTPIATDAEPTDNALLDAELEAFTGGDGERALVLRLTRCDLAALEIVVSPDDVPSLMLMLYRGLKGRQNTSYGTGPTDPHCVTYLEGQALLAQLDALLRA